MENLIITLKDIKEPYEINFICRGRRSPFLPRYDPNKAPHNGLGAIANVNIYKDGREPETKYLPIGKDHPQYVSLVRSNSRASCPECFTNYEEGKDEAEVESIP